LSDWYKVALQKVFAEVVCQKSANELDEDLFGAAGYASAQNASAQASGKEGTIKEVAQQ